MMMKFDCIFNIGQRKKAVSENMPSKGYKKWRKKN